MIARKTRIVVPRSFPWQRDLERAFAEETNRFIVCVMGRRAGKTTALAKLAGRTALDQNGHGKPGAVFWGAPTHDLSAIGREKFESFWTPVVRRDTKNPSNAWLAGGGRVYWRSFHKDAAGIGRGFDLVTIDEAARVKERIVYEDILPTIADTGGRIVAITTPRGAKNWVYQWVRRAKEGAPGYALVHGPSTSNPSPLIRDFVEIARENMPDELYRQEILAEFIEGEGAVFRKIREAARLPAGYRDRPASSEDVYAIGCDLAKHRDWTVLYAIHVSTGEVHGADRFQRIDWPLQKARIREFWLRWNRGPIWIDATGIGDPIYDDLVLSMGLNVRPYKFSSESKSAIVVALMTALERGEIAFPCDDEGLIGELEVFEYEVLPSGKFKYGAPEPFHDDRVFSLGLANLARCNVATGGFATEEATESRGRLNPFEGKRGRVG